MTATAFISYAHADAKALDRLHKHLAMLRREGALTAWTDHEILPGDRVDGAINTQLAQSSLFIALVSPDYLDSRYCYEKEFQRALELASEGKLRIMPVILEPCDWLASPLQEFLALPKDGVPISNWTNQNNAYLDVVTGLRRVLKGPEDRKAGSLPMLDATIASARRPRIKQDFDAIQRADFADKVFGVIQDYFRVSCEELSRIEDLRARFEVIDQTAFTCSVVNRARVNGGEAHITVRNAKGRGMGFGGDISYVNQRYAEANTSNGSIRIEHDAYQQYLTLDSFGMSGREKERLTPGQAAEQLWTAFVHRAGIEYD
jgi:hypothetical protein